MATMCRRSHRASFATKWKSETNKTSRQIEGGRRTDEPSGEEAEGDVANLSQTAAVDLDHMRNL